jgi:CHAD domain-containing protein
VTKATTHREVERKLRVHGLFQMPDLVEAGVAARAEHLEPFVMRAVYHDTDELTLFRWGITLRRREGGPDEGWHMKLPVAGVDGSSRDELQVPLDSGAIGSVPGAFVEVIAPLVRNLPLGAAVTLSTERAPTLLYDEAGVARVEVVDDIVTVLHQGRTVSVFREVEIEALDSTDPEALQMMERVCELLVGLGAEPSTVSKAASALGPRTAEPPDVPAHPMPGPEGLAVDAVKAVFSQHVRHLLMSDVAVRRDLPDSVHQMRVAARRIRSAMTTFAPLLENDGALADELRWMAQELGAIRDTEVLLDRLDSHAGELDDPADAVRARAVIDPLLNDRLVAARSSALAALRSDRHQQLVEDLVAFANEPPVVDAAYVSCDEVLLPLVAKTWARLDRAVGRLDLEGPSAPWHVARIKAKRARYAAESVSDVFGKRMRQLASTLAEVTEILGDHQDAHVAQTVIRELAAHPATDGPSGLALGLLHEYEYEVETLDRLRFVELWQHARRRAHRADVA